MTGVSEEDNSFTVNLHHIKKEPNDISIASHVFFNEISATISNKLTDQKINMAAFIKSESVDETIGFSDLTYNFDSGVTRTNKQEYHYKEEVNLNWDEENFFLNEADISDNKPIFGEKIYNTNICEERVIIKNEITDIKLSLNPKVNVEKLTTSTLSQKSVSAKIIKTDWQEKSEVPSTEGTKLWELVKRRCLTCGEQFKVTHGSIYTAKKRCESCNSKTPLVFECFRCGKRYSNYDSVVYHVRSKCDPGKRFDCSECTYGTTIRSQLSKHMRRMHKSKIDSSDNRKAIVCSKCGKDFKYRWSLNRHVEQSRCSTELVKHVKCPECGKRYKNVYSLGTHVKYYCGKKANLCCNHCSYRTKYKLSIILHLQRYHPIDGNDNKCSYRSKIVAPRKRKRIEK